MNLLPFQKIAVKEMHNFLNRTHGVYNACEQGLGKTIQTIAVLNDNEFPRVIDAKQDLAETVLIFAPVSMLYTWKAELEKWLKNKATIAIANTKNIVQACADADIVICPYSISFRKEIHPYLMTFPWTYLIMDEAHQLKNRKAQRTKAILGYQRGSKYYQGIWDYSKFRIALSGTPFTNGIPDGYSLFHKFFPKSFSDYYSFVGNYCFARKTPWTVEYYGLKNGEQLRTLIRDNFYIRKTKSEVLKDLPSKTYQRITLPPEYAYVAKKEEKDLAEIIIKQIKKTGTVPVLPATWQAKRLEEAKRKLPIIIEFVEDLLKEDVPIVLFAYHREIIRELEFQFKKYTPAVITGDTVVSSRQSAIRAFQSDCSTPLFIGQISAAGLGITLTRASTVVLAELDYTPATISQAVDRIHRIGQHDAVVAYYFIAEGSIEQGIAEAVIEKAQIINQVV